MIEAYQEQAERLADLLLEQLERIEGSEHEEAYVLTLVVEQLVGRVAELGEVVEFEARDLDDHAALQMATALQAHCASLRTILDQVAGDPRFGLLPRRDRGALPPRPPQSPGARGDRPNGHTPDNPARR